jgi:hypothetical protein
MIVSGLETVYGGGTDGYVRSLNISAKNIDTTGIINPYVETPHLNYGSSVQNKTIDKVGITLSPTGDDTVVFSWTRDTQYTQSVTISQGEAGDLLRDDNDPQGDDFMLSDDTAPDSATDSVLAGTNFNEVYNDLEEGGDFRWIQYIFKNQALNDELVLHAFGTGLQFDAIGTES